MRISDWSSDVCSSDLAGHKEQGTGNREHKEGGKRRPAMVAAFCCAGGTTPEPVSLQACPRRSGLSRELFRAPCRGHEAPGSAPSLARDAGRSEEHTSELQSLMRISYAVFCLKKQQQNKRKTNP